MSFVGIMKDGLHFSGITNNFRFYDYLENIFEYTFYGSNDDDIIEVDVTNRDYDFPMINKIYGGSRNDILKGNYENDIFYGGVGNDYLESGYSNDIYIIGRDDGQDIVIVMLLIKIHYYLLMV